MNKALWLVGITFSFGFGLAFWFQQIRINSIETAHVHFLDQTRLLAKQAEQDANKKASFYKETKEKSDVESKKTIASLRDDVSRLRKQYSGASIVPAVPTNTGGLGILCFDRGELAQAVDNLTHGLWGIAEQGDKDAASLSSAREWANNISHHSNTD